MLKRSRIGGSHHMMDLLKKTGSIGNVRRLILVISADNWDTPYQILYKTHVFGCKLVYK